jgi:hypothetical protein
MTRISNVDQMLLLLRQQLQRMERPDHARRGAKAAKSGASQRQGAAQRIEALAQAGDMSEEEFARSLIGALLVDEFGEAAANDHRFQKLTDEVHRILSSDAKARGLLADALKLFGRQGRG